jgi:quercetin dioxygenase-like cupin family protein
MLIRRYWLLVLGAAAIAACAHVDTDKTDSPYAAASGITRPAGDARAFRTVPLRPMTGDVEILYGDPEKAGEPFAMRIRELPGTMIPPHTHPVDEHITIVQGTWYFAEGETWDKSKLRELRTGDYAFAPQGSTMFGYCPDGAVVQVHGIGPFHIHFIHGTKTLDDADARSTFTFQRGDRVQTPRGRGTIRNGYASGSIIQYEIQGDDGNPYMANQSDTSRIGE